MLERPVKESKGFQKEQEYPNIKWDRLEDPLVQRAVVLYNDRVNSWRKMVQIDKVIDQKPTPARIQELAELRIRNLQAFRELDHFNSTGEYLNRHPLVAHFDTRQQLEKLLKENPDAFLEEYANCRENVKRYRSFLNNKKRNEKHGEKDKVNLKKHLDREAMMKEILTESHG